MKLKHVTLALTALLSFGALTSCGDSSDPNVNLTIKAFEDPRDLHLDYEGKCVVDLGLGNDFKLGDYKAHEVVFEASDSSVKIATGSINDFNPGASYWKATFSKVGTYTISAKVGSNKSKNNLAFTITEARPIEYKYKLPTAPNWKMTIGSTDNPADDIELYKVGEDFLRIEGFMYNFYEKGTGDTYTLYRKTSDEGWNKKEGKTYTLEQVKHNIMQIIFPAISPDTEYKTKTTGEVTVKFITSEKTEDRKLPVTTYTTLSAKYNFYNGEDFAICADYDGENFIGRDFHYTLKVMDYTVTQFPDRPTK